MSDKNAVIVELDKAIQSFQTQIDQFQKQIDAIKATRDSFANNPALRSLYDVQNNIIIALEAQKQEIVNAQDTIKAKKEELQSNNITVYVLIILLIILCFCSSSALAAILLYMYNK